MSTRAQRQMRRKVDKVGKRYLKKLLAKRRKDGFDDVYNEQQARKQEERLVSVRSYEISPSMMRKQGLL